MGYIRHLGRDTILHGRIVMDNRNFVVVTCHTHLDIVMLEHAPDPFLSSD